MELAEKYDVEPFDINDPREARSEKARKAVIDAFLNCDEMIYTGDDLQDVMCGLLFGVVCIMGSQLQPTDESHAALRASVLQMTPYSVDLYRSMLGLDPLVDAQ